MKKLVNIIFSQEFVLMLFLNAGFYKSVIPINNYLDLTILTMLFSISLASITVLKQAKIKKMRLNFILLFCFFTLLIFISLFHTPNFGSGLYKALNFAVIGGWSFLAPLFIISNLTSLERFLHSYLILGLITGLETFRVHFGNLSSFSQDLIFGSDYLAVGRVLGYCICIVISAIILNERKTIDLLLSLVLLFIFVTALMLTGGRGPLVAILVASFLIIIKQTNLNYRKGVIKYNKKAVIGLFTLFASVIYFFLSDNLIFNQLKIRLSHFSDANGGDSVSGRLSRFDVAFEMIKSKPIFGSGIDSFSYFTGAPENYPHNIFLEIFSELGIIGLMSFILLISSALLKFPYKSLTLKSKYQNISWSIFAMFIFSLINANISGNIQGNRITFALCAILVAFSDIYKRDSQ